MKGRAVRRVTGWDVGAELIELLGLPDSGFNITINVPLDGAVTVEYAFYPNPSQVAEITEAIARYAVVEIVEKEPGK